MSTTSNPRLSGEGQRKVRKYFFPVPNIVLELGLTPYELALYCAIRRTTDETGRCFRSGTNLARLCGMSTGAVSKAKRRLNMPFAMLGMKPLINISLRPSPHGGKPCHHITLVDIWSENQRYFRHATSCAEEADDVATSPEDLATSPKKLASSSSETKKTPEVQKTPLRKTKEEDGTPSNPSTREDERETRPEEINFLWNFVCKLFNRTSERPPNTKEIKAMEQLLPIPQAEYERVEWWYSLNARNYDCRQGAGFALQRRPSSVHNLLLNWSNLLDVAGGFQRQFEEEAARFKKLYPNG